MSSKNKKKRKQSGGSRLTPEKILMVSCIMGSAPPEGYRSLGDAIITPMPWEGFVELPPILLGVAGRELYHFTSLEAWEGIRERGEILSVFTYLFEVFGVGVVAHWLWGYLKHHMPFVWLTDSPDLQDAYPKAISQTPKQVRVTISKNALVSDWLSASLALGIVPTIDSFVVPSRLSLDLCVRAERLSDGAVLWQRSGPPAPRTRLQEVVRTRVPIINVTDEQLEELATLNRVLKREFQRLRKVRMEKMSTAMTTGKNLPEIAKALERMIEIMQWREPAEH